VITGDGHNHRHYVGDHACSKADGHVGITVTVVLMIAG